MVANSSLGAICSANSPHVTPANDGSSWLYYVCLTFYLGWLTVVIGVMTLEWSRRGSGLPVSSRLTSRGAQNLTRISSGLTQGRSLPWVIWLPLLVGIPPSMLTILWVLSTPRSSPFYTKSQATMDFLESCSDPTASNLTSHAAYQVFFVACDAVQNRMNADIGGIGIRISLYVSFLVTIFSSFLGHFHQEKTAVKDIGTAQLTCKCIDANIRLALTSKFSHAVSSIRTAQVLHSFDLLAAYGRRHVSRNHQCDCTDGSFTKGNSSISLVGCTQFRLSALCASLTSYRDWRFVPTVFCSARPVPSMCTSSVVGYFRFMQKGTLDVLDLLEHADLDCRTIMRCRTPSYALLRPFRACREGREVDQENQLEQFSSPTSDVD